MNEINYFVPETTSGILGCSDTPLAALLEARTLLFIRGEHEPDLLPRGLSIRSRSALSSLRGS